MNRQFESEPSPNVPKSSVLLPLGIALMVLGLLVPRPLGAAAQGMEPGLKSIALILTDVFSVGFFGGVGCLIIGILRNKKAPRPTRP
jgi:hypothetical protein